MSGETTDVRKRREELEKLLGEVEAQALAALTARTPIEIHPETALALVESVRSYRDLAHEWARKSGEASGVGPIPDGLHIHHVCNDPGCVNPEHLKPLTPSQNTRINNAPPNIAHRAGTCMAGHPITPENSVLRGGRMRCKICVRRQRRANYLAVEKPKRQAAAASRPPRSKWRGRPLISEQQKAAASEMRAAGVPMRAVAAFLGCSLRHAYDITWAHSRATAELARDGHLAEHNLIRIEVEL